MSIVTAEEVYLEYWLAPKLGEVIMVDVASSPEVTEEKLLEAYTLAFSVSKESCRNGSSTD